MKSSDYIVDFLADHGVKHCYGFQGTMIAHLFDSICKSNRMINHVCYNEQGAAFAAVGEAKATGKTAFAYSTSGPGAANLISGIADAYYDSVPVIFITGQLNTYEYQTVPNIKQHGFQEMDVISIVRPIVKYCEKVEKAEDLRRILEQAWYFANEGRKGPVLIDLPMDMQRQEIEPQKLQGFEIPVEDSNEEKLEEIAQYIIGAILKAEKPVLLLGNGIDKENRNNIEELINKIQIPVITSMLGRDVLPSNHKLNFGFVGAAYGHRYANLIIHKKADLIVSLGCSVCKRQTGMKTENFAREADLIRVDIDKTELVRKVHKNEISFLVDCNKLIEKLVEMLQDVIKKPEWFEICDEIRSQLISFDASCDERKPNHIVELISKYTESAGAICCDVGQHQIWGAQSYNVKKNQRILFSGGHGAMGFALPAAIGAHYGVNQPVVAICGDGAFQMNIQELQWVVREEVPVTIFVMNNTALGLIHQQQDDIFEGRYYGSVAEGGYSTPDFVKIGNAYGIKSYQVESEDELEKLLAGLDYSRSSLVEVKLDVRSRAYPKTFFGEEMHNQRPYIPEILLNELLEKGE